MVATTGNENRAPKVCVQKYDMVKGGIAVSQRNPRAKPRSRANVPSPATSREREDQEWERRAGTAEFKALLAAKVRFIVPATIFFIVYYFALLILVGYARGLMETRIFGAVNLAYLFALSQFFVAWILAWLYLRRAARFDALAKSILGKLGGGK
jgi:uncharacterized membrane protein (DUF485 family)